MLRHLTLGLALCAALSACGGGGSSSSALPAGPASPLPIGPQSVTMAIKIPTASSGTSALHRRPLYVSAATQSASIVIGTAAPVVVNLTATSPNCTTTASGRTCTVTLSAPVGPDTFAETLYSLPNATGSVLSLGKTSWTIVAGTANTVQLALSGVIASLSVTLTPSVVTVGTSALAGLTVNFNDASGDAIIGSDSFATPVTVTDTDASTSTALISGSTSATTLTLNKPSDAASLSVGYTAGATTFTNAVIAAAAGAGVAASATLTAQAAPTPTPTPNAVGFNDYATFGYDNQRDVYNPNSTAITPASVSSIHLGWTADVKNYNTQTQPILATNIPGHAGVLFIGGGTGTVYGYDALTGTQLWHYETGQETYTCENNNTIYFGVGGSVAYDRASKSIYVVGNQNATPNAPATNSLYHLDGATGALLGNVNFAPALAGWNALDFSHTSVTLGANGLAYVGTGATCDKSSWRGRVAAISVPSMTLADTFFTVWNGTSQPWGGGGIWGWGGVSLDFDGNVLTGVGNTDNGSTTQGQIVAPFVASPTEYSGNGESLIKLSANLSTVEDSNHPIPTSAYSGNSLDLDVQGTPAIFKPNGAGCDPMAAVQGKSGTLFLYDATRIGNGTVAQYQLAPSSYQDSFIGGPAFSAATGLVYEAVPSSSNSLYPPGLIAVNPGCGRPYVQWHSAFGPDSGASGTPRSVPAASAGGVVFVGTPCTSDGNGGCAGTAATAVSRSAQTARRKPAICCAPAGSGAGALWVLDASTGQPLNGGLPLLITSGPLREPPTIDGKWIFVLDENGEMYGLTIDASYPAVQERMRAVDSHVLRQWEAPPKI